MKLAGKGRASVGRGTAVLSTPDRRGGVPFSGAAIVDAETATGHGQIKLVAANVCSSVGRLNDHGHAGDGGAGEGELVALAARRVGRGYGSKAVCHSVANGPWALV